MAHIRRVKRKTKLSYQAIVRRVGFKTLTKSFASRMDAQKWARDIELNLDRGISTDFTEASRVS